MYKKNILSLAILLITFASSMQGNTYSSYFATVVEPSTFDTIKASCQAHPVIATLAAATALFGLSYGYTQLMRQHDQIKVNLIQYNCPKSNNESSQENYLFAHGIAETHEQAYWYTKGKSNNLPYLINGQLFTYDFPDATQRFWHVNFTQTGLGQYNEIMGLKNAHEQTTQKLKVQNESPQDLILMGMSRGATTILNFVGLYKPNNVKAIIVESPFDSTHSVAKNMLKQVYLDNVPGMQTIAHAIMSLVFWQHSTAGINAIDSVKYIDKDLPILLVCSRKDALIPAESTIELYKALRDSGHHKVHMYIADAGRHGRILHDSDGLHYQHIVHAFYKKYGLVHDTKLADQGASLLNESQPNL